MVSSSAFRPLSSFGRWQKGSPAIKHRTEPSFAREVIPMLKLFTNKTKPAPEVLARWVRNDPCWCGSGKKYKLCHLSKDQAKK
jgi:uncharacterized protein YecA (UPF0149 family)